MKHSALWWLFIGWWWIFLKPILWLAFLPITIFFTPKKKKQDLSWIDRMEDFDAFMN